MKPYDIKNDRVSDHEIDNLFVSRWSPRSISSVGFSGGDLLSLFEAARWAPSASNVQPWRFLFALNGSKDWDLFEGLLVDFNKLWAKSAGALVVILSNKFNGEGKPNPTHSFDAGAAWQNFALQARLKGFVAHGMAGFDYVKAKELLRIPDSFNVEAMIAVGSQGEVENLHERMRKSEKPNSRVSVESFSSCGVFPKSWVKD